MKFFTCLVKFWTLLYGSKAQWSNFQKANFKGFKQGQFWDPYMWNLSFGIFQIRVLIHEGQTLPGPNRASELFETGVFSTATAELPDNIKSKDTKYFQKGHKKIIFWQKYSIWKVWRSKFGLGVENTACLDFSYLMDWPSSSYFVQK